ncbi:GPX3 peroxidase, partial [Polyodon spathula]|nr:GPX3 peroxidase [Polyodon spathula]
MAKHVLEIWAIILVILATIIIMTSLLVCPALSVIIYRVVIQAWFIKSCLDLVLAMLWRPGAGAGAERQSRKSASDPPELGGENIESRCNEGVHQPMDSTPAAFGISAASTWDCRSAELNALHEELRPYGFIILGFPSNQFGMQEPGENNEILSTLKYIRPGGGFVPNFQLFQKGAINGQHEQKVYTFLKNSCPPVGDSFGNPTNRLFWEPLRVKDVKWNFEKFLVGPDGKPVMRWYPRVNVSAVRKDILDYLRRQASQRRVSVQLPVLEPWKK